MAGRKLKLNKKLIQRAERLIKAGNYTKTVYEYLGIGSTTWHRWLNEGKEQKSGLKREFWETIKKAEQEAEIRLVTDLQKLGQDKGDWKAIAWMLERKYPEHWGRKEKQTIEHTGKDGGAIETSHTEKMDLSNLTDEELTDLERIIDKSISNGNQTENSENKG